MKIMFISDIHGIKTNLLKVKEVFEKENCDKLVVLGDLYYIGPRNRMIEGYDITFVKDFLNSFKDKLICLKGNCDSEVDIMVSDFPIVNELSLISVDNKDIYLTHGHIYNENNWNKENTILIYGHLHIPFIKEIGNNTYINPGSISLPKENNKPSYLIYNDNKFTIYDINENVLFEKEI
jgi:hypothetical protein